MSGLSIVLNPPQVRLKSKSVSTLVSGLDWIQPNFGNSGGIWIDPVTFTAMLQPNWINPSWTTSGTGIFAKLGISDFTLTPTPDGTNWIADSPGADGSPFRETRLPPRTCVASRRLGALGEYTTGTPWGTGSQNITTQYQVGSAPYLTEATVWQNRGRFRSSFRGKSKPCPGPQRR